LSLTAHAAIRGMSCSMNLLVNPPFYRFIGLEQDYVPLSLLSVGSYMKQQGEDVIVNDALENTNWIHRCAWACWAWSCG
jgi:hypothetical protein